MHRYDAFARCHQVAGGIFYKSYGDSAASAITFAYGAPPENEGGSHYQVGALSVDNEVVTIAVGYCVGVDAVFLDFAMQHCAELQPRHIDCSFFSHNLLLFF